MTKLGRYEIGALLGEGGAGRVYLSALHGPGFSRPVALKVLTGGGRLLEREARLGGLLRHPNLVDVFEIGEDQGVWYCALEYCAGGSLDERLPLPPRAVVELGLQVCAALQYAHDELGLVHLDIKPRNLLISEGRVKVCDLGISVAEGFDLPGRHGTPGYMAPELFGGGPVGVRADVYGLGMTLFHLATGQAPIRVDTPPPAPSSPRMAQEETRRVLEPLSLPATPVATPPDRVSLAQLPEWLAPVVRRCVAPDPDDRWPDMAALARALGDLDVAGPSLSDAVGWVRPVAPQQAAGSALGDEPDAFVGREGDLARLADGLQTPGILTLKGPPGVGKSRLASTATRRWLRAGGRAWVCPLVEVRTQEDLLIAVARTLGVPLSKGDQAAHLDRLGQSLAQRGPCVLILDNFEQIANLAPVVAQWREQAPNARLLVTSRVPLGATDERIFEVAPMPAADAVALLVVRAQQRGVQVSETSALTELAARLDGLPLALELAAGRLGVLSVHDILARLDLSLLRSGTEDRHATLRGALEWSWALLSDPERSALAQLSVFAGGATILAAEEVLEIDGSVLDVVTSLVDRSLLRVAENGRLQLYESVREFAAEKLADPLPAERRHAAHFSRCGSDAGLRALGQSGGVALYRRLLRDRENVWLATRRATGWREGVWAAQLLFAGWKFVFRDGPYDAAYTLAMEVQAWDDLSPSLQARVSVLTAHLLRRLGRIEAARAQLECALATWRTLDAPRHEADAYKLLGGLQQHQGQGQEAGRSFATALALAREGRCRRREAGVRAVLGDLCRVKGRLEEARSHYLAALTGFQEIGDRDGEVVPRGGLGLLCNLQRRHDAAAVHFEQALTVLRETGAVRNQALLLNNLGLVRHEQGRLDEAKGHFEASLRLGRETQDLFCAAIARGNLGRIYAAEGQFSKAAASFEAALETYRAFEHPHGACNILVNLGLMSRRRGDADGAMRTLREALELARDGGFRVVEGFVLTELGDLCRSGGQFEEAGTRLDAALALYREIDAPTEKARALWSLGALARQCGRLDEARIHYDAALEAACAGESPAIEGIVHAHIGRLVGEEGDPKAARVHLDAALALLRGRQPDYLAEVHAIDAKLLWGLGQHTAARLALDKARAVGVSDAALQQEMAALQALFDGLSDPTGRSGSPSSDA